MTQFKRKKSRFPVDTPIWVLQFSLVGCLVVWVGLLFVPFGIHDAALERNTEQLKEQMLTKKSLLRSQFVLKKSEAAAAAAAAAAPLVKPPAAPAVPGVPKAAGGAAVAAPKAVVGGSNLEGDGNDDATGEAENDDSEPKKDEKDEKEAANGDDDKAEGNNESVDNEADEEDVEEDVEKDADADEEDGEKEADEEDGDEGGAEAANSEDKSAEADGGDEEGEGEENAEDEKDADEAKGGEADAEDADEKGDADEEEEDERRRLNDGEEELDSRRFVMEISGLMGADASGRVVIETRPAWAPNGADHFYQLIENGFYNQCRFFRVVPNFIVQFGIAGNPEVQRMWGDDVLVDDPVKKSNERGTLTYATAGPNTRTTQLFFNTKNNRFLDDEGFAPFAEVVEGMEFIDQINDEYGEAPHQGLIEDEGNEYLDEKFPNLSYIVEIVEDLETRN